MLKYVLILYVCLNTCFNTDTHYMTASLICQVHLSPWTGDSRIMRVVPRRTHKWFPNVDFHFCTSTWFSDILKIKQSKQYTIYKIIWTMKPTIHTTPLSNLKHLKHRNDDKSWCRYRLCLGTGTNTWQG